jgi:16S rRNA (guanine527-N7)-methyltransferase
MRWFAQGAACNCARWRGAAATAHRGELVRARRGGGCAGAAWSGYTAAVTDTVECNAIAAIARQWKVELPTAEIIRLEAYLRELVRWNQHVNLTGAKSVSELIGEHLPDSFAISQLCPPGTKVVDVGAGGGLPGVPLAVLRPDCHVTLVEPRAKRVAFLRTALRLAAVGNALVLRGRSEDVLPADFPLAVSRATFSPDEWLAVAVRLLTPQGAAIVLSARRHAESVGGARLDRFVAYETASGVSRWAGAYCFT